MISSKTNFIKKSFEVDLNLLHLYKTLSDLDFHYIYPDDIHNRLRSFINDLSSIIFPDVPSDFDVIDEKLYFVIDYEKFNCKNKN